MHRYKELSVEKLQELVGNSHDLSGCKLLGAFKEVLPVSFMKQIISCNNGIFTFHIGSVFVYIIRNVLDTVVVYKLSELPIASDDIFCGNYTGNRESLVREMLLNSNKLGLTAKLNLIRYYFKTTGVSKSVIDIFTNKPSQLPSVHAYAILALITAGSVELDTYVILLTNASVAFLDALEDYNSTLDFMFSDIVKGEVKDECIRKTE